MKGMLMKDLMNLKQQARVYLLIIAVWLVVGVVNRDAAFFGGVMMMLTVLVPMSAVAFDEKAKWDRYALTMPVSRADMVLSKYILALGCAVAGGIVAEVVSVLISKNVAESLATNIAFTSVGIIFASVIFPMIFKLGVEKGRLMIIAVALVPMLVVFTLSKLNIDMPSEEMIEGAAYFSPIIGAAAFTISFFISKRIYERKEF